MTAVVCHMRANALCHAYPTLSPARALLVRISLGLRPWLHQLRSGSLRFVRRLHSYYGGVRLLMSVHHRLRLLTFPMRTADANLGGKTRGIPGSDAIHLRVMCSSTPAGRQCLA